MCERKNGRSSWFLRRDLGLERIVVSIMTGNRCVLCVSTRATDPGASFHRFPAGESEVDLQLGASEQLSFLSPDLRQLERPFFFSGILP